MGTYPTGRQAVLLTPDARAFVEARAERTHRNARKISGALSTAVERYAYLIDQGWLNVVANFDQPQIGLLCDILNGTLITTDTIPNLWMEVADAEEEYFDRWYVDRADLIARLQRARLHELTAIADYVERYWRSGGQTPA